MNVERLYVERLNVEDSTWNCVNVEVYFLFTRVRPPGTPMRTPRPKLT